MKTQERVFKAICDHLERNEYPPTIRELQVAVGIRSSSTVYGHLERLKRKGYIDWNPSQPRTLRVLRHDIRWVPVYTPDKLVEAYKKGALTGRSQ